MNPSILVESATGRSGPSLPDSQAAGTTILIVDDDAPMRLLLERYLDLLSYEAVLAADGEEALRIAGENPHIALVMLDVVMSGISGKELAERLMILLPNAPILFCSGHPAPALARLGINLESGQFMQKPCRPLELKQRLSEMLAARR